MKKFIIFLIVFLSISCQTFAVDLSDFSTEIKKYSNDFFPELGDSNVLENFMNMENTLNINNMLNRLLNGITGEFKNNISLIFKILGIAILCVILKSIQSNFGEGGVSEIAFYVCYLLVVVLVMTSFTNITELCKNTIKTLSSFMEFLIPIIISLLAITGKVTTISVIQPVLLAMISIITLLLANIIMPVVFIATVLNLVSNISERISIKKLGDFLKKGALWCIEILLVIFGGVLSLEGTLASNVDGVAAKTTKTVVSNVIPVVGKLLGDTVDSVIGGLLLTKNVVGTIGILVIVSITIIPLIRALILMLTFNFASSIIEPIADSRLVKCVSGMGDSIKVIFAILAITTFLFIIAIGLMIKISN